MRVLREGWLADDVLVELVPEEVSTAGAPVAVVHAEEGTLGPLVVLQVRPVRRLHYVQHDRHPVLIVATDYPLVRVHRVACYLTVTTH